MENATAWQEERAPGRQHQQQQGRACPYCTVLGPGHGERAAPAPGTSLSTQKLKEERQGALEQTDSTVPALSPEASLIPGELVLPPGTAHSPEGVGLSQRFVPLSSQASSTGPRRRQTQALQRANTGDLHVSPKHESEPVVPRPCLLTRPGSRMYDIAEQQHDSRREKATAAIASPRHGTPPTNRTGSSTLKAGGQRAGWKEQSSALKSPQRTPGQV